VRDQISDRAFGKALLDPTPGTQQLDVRQRLADGESTLEPGQVVPRPATAPAHPRGDLITGQSTTRLFAQQLQHLLEAPLMVREQLAGSFRQTLEWLSMAGQHQLCFEAADQPQR